MFTNVIIRKVLFLGIKIIRNRLPLDLTNEEITERQILSTFVEQCARSFHQFCSLCQLKIIAIRLAILSPCFNAAPKSTRQLSSRHQRHQVSRSENVGLPRYTRCRVTLSYRRRTLSQNCPFQYAHKTILFRMTPNSSFAECS